MKKWEEFETFIADLQAQTAPNATVQHNQRVRGRSGRLRQLDITLSQKVGLYPVFIVIECKHYRRRVAIEKVEAFVTKLRDVGASHGVMISNTGFDEGAKAIAKDNLVTLLSYREARELDWSKLVGSEAWVKFILTEPEGVSIVFVDSDQRQIAPPLKAIIHDLEKKPLGSVEEWFRNFGEELFNALGVGPFTCQLNLAPRVYVEIDGEFREIQSIIIEGEVKGREYVLNLNLASGHVLENTVTQAEVYNQVNTQGIDWREVIRTHPAREITQEEYEASMNTTGFPPVSLNLNKVKRYIRFQITKKQ